jgi:hypothetical protein
MIFFKRLWNASVCQFQMGTWRIQVNNNTLKNVCSFLNAILHLSFRSAEWRTR